MRRIFLDKINDIVTLTGEQHVHLSVVLRARVGDSVDIATGDGFVYSAAITSINSKNTVLKVTDKRVDGAEPDVKVSLYFAALKGEHNDLVVQKAVELGVSRLIPVKTKYTGPQAPRIDRLNKIAFSACAQSGRGKLVAVEEIVDFDSALQEIKKYDLAVFLYEKAVTPALKVFLRSNLCKSVRNIAILIGGEGGFSADEVLAAKNTGLTPLTLGNRILRAETASIAVLSCIMYELANED